MNQTAIETLTQWGYVWPDKTTLSLACSGDHEATALRKAWRRALAAAFNAQTLRTGYAIKGRQLTLEHLGTLQAHHEAWAARVTEAQGLSALLAARLDFGLAPPADLGGLRQQMLQKGLLPSAWKWLRAQPATTAQKLFSLGVTPESVWWANVLAKTQVPSSRLSAWLEPGRLKAGEELFRWTRDNPAQAPWLEVGLQRLLRALPVATQQALMEWELLLGHLTPQLNLRQVSRPWVAPNATWNSLRRQAHAEVQQRLRNAAALAQAKSQEASEQVWPSRLSTFALPEPLKQVEVTELTSAEALKQEGALMSHCVGNGTYVEACLRAEQVIVRLQEPFMGQLATLQLRKSTGGWQLAQLAGPNNRKVPQLFWRVARHLVEHLQACR